MSRMEYSILKEKMKDNECGWSEQLVNTRSEPSFVSGPVGFHELDSDRN
jgi:hypothetical protein